MPLQITRRLGIISRLNGDAQLSTIDHIEFVARERVRRIFRSPAQQHWDSGSPDSILLKSCSKHFQVRSTRSTTAPVASVPSATTNTCFRVPSTLALAAATEVFHGRTALKVEGLRNALHISRPSLSDGIYVCLCPERRVVLSKPVERCGEYQGVMRGQAALSAKRAARAAIPIIMRGDP
jgi:hypothetical protein